MRYDETDPLCEPFVAQALAAQPEVLFLGASKPDAVVCIARQARTLSPTTRLFFSDSAYFPALITKLGTLAEGLEGTVPSPDPGSGFETAYRVHFGHPPPPYAANLYDALTLLAYSLERSNGEGGERLADALVDVVDARGPATGWDRQGIGEALTGIKNGHLPDVQGASGPLDFDPDLHTEPVASVYGHWRIEYGDFVTLAFISTGASKRATSLSRSFASHKRSQKLDSNSSYNPGPKAKTWALIAALSGGWQNYRHQADALAHYQALRANGIPDDHLVLVLADDLATNSQSAEPGMVRNVAGGPNLYAEVEIDYSLEELTADDLLAILAGKSSPELPVVIDSSADDNVYVFLVGHGNSSGVLVGGSRAGMEQGAGETLLLPEQLAATAASMFAHKRYRRLLIAVEACHGGILGTQLESPGVLLLAGANPTESSLGSNYDPDFDLWRADQFAYQLYLANTTTPTLALDELYQQLYLQVGGSHVTAYNANNFSGISTVTLQEFVQ
ncbi:MAG: hypothetical protein A2284_18625 [Deltaproteobacteria bacterium RIFOXYA12_FULL_61_11]|nr:MAG: hypothetical protein A2284_18625 [Deltaproteobacteria bacterium RIFOXYA12_FULL_61_11]